MKSFRKPMLILAIATMAIAGAAFAAAESTKVWGAFYPKLPSWLGGGMYVGLTATASTTNKVTKALAASIDWNFPPVDGPIVALGTPCRDSAALTLSGVTFGDTCSAGYCWEGTATSTCSGGVVIPDFQYGTLHPRVTAANTVVLALCGTGMSDGGQVDPPDASYTIRCFSNH